MRIKQKGQSLVEFALILPLLLMLLLGIIEGGRIIWAYITVQNAAREAARYAVTGRPFACGSDPAATDLPGALDPANYCDDSINGDPWSTQVLTSTRVAAIKDVAYEYGQFLNVSIWAKDNVTEYNLHRDQLTPGAFGIAVIGQDAAGSQPNYGGQPGWNVRVETYYNVEMIDPIFDVIMGGQSIHLSGQVELQNEGIDPSVQGYTGGITYQTDSCAPDCGVSSAPFIMVQDEFADLSEPAGGNFSVSVNDHQALTNYTLWFVRDGLFADSINFTTDQLGSKLLNFVISASAPQSPTLPQPVWDYKIYTTLAGNTTPVASCLGDLPANAPCFQVTIGNATIEARNLTQDDQRQQPLATARWPISSSIPIYLFNHDTGYDYSMKFNGLDSGSAPGSLWFDGASSTIIPTDLQFGTNQGSTPAYYIATGYAPTNLTISSEDLSSTEIASTTVELIAARIDIFGEVPGKTHPATDILWITLRNHAPLQQYQVVFDDGITPPAVVRANERGELTLNYVVPDGVHEPSPILIGDPNYHPPVPVNIYTLDYNRGPNPNRIAERIISVFTPNDPYINVPGGARWPAGSPITIQLRRHSPLTDYGIYLQQGSATSPSFSELINGTIINTHVNPVTGLGEYDMAYTIPAAYVGFYIIRSFEPSAPTTEVAAFNIEFTSNGQRRANDEPVTDKPGSHNQEIAKGEVKRKT
ncbi:TadE/TadG family type IV pilus assembly protein [Chloroflexota bacterium]